MLFRSVRDQKIHIKECTIQKSQEKHHPFANGRVYKILPNGNIKIIAKDAFLIIKKISVNGKEVVPSNIIKINDVLYTPSNFIDLSRQMTVPVKRM